MAKKRKRIKELGFLRETRKGRQRFYSLDLGRMGQVIGLSACDPLFRI